VLNLSIWFGLNAMFGRTGKIKLIGAAITVPEIRPLTGSPWRWPRFPAWP